jgi:peptide/nickel transport system permease protein
MVRIACGLPGLGREAVQAIANQDLTIIMGITVLSVTLVVAANLVVDVAQALLDHRVRLE